MELVPVPTGTHEIHKGVRSSIMLESGDCFSELTRVSTSLIRTGSYEMTDMFGSRGKRF